ncbi:MAG: ABC transporter substrate-binding protein [Sideroxydans sp.]|nr:ABC transporter substrate-binding protein [Sideroxydans sp.]NOT97985.1 ABC transporter substrate-binding protein [Sideroxydans sp.]
MRKLFAMVSFVLMSSAASAVSMDESAPDVLVNQTVQEVLDIVKKDSAVLTNETRLNELVDAKIVPHFNFARMTKLAVGKAWRTATPEQQQVLNSEFRTMLVRTYTKVFTAYRDPKVTVKPVQVTPETKETTVKLLITISDGRTVKVEYEMERAGLGWKVFDVTVEGISLVTSYRGSFGDEIQQNGVDGLVKKLTEMNHAALVSSNKRAQVK